MANIELWQQEAAKLGGESLVQVITDIRDDQLRIIERLDQMDERHKNAEANLSRLFSAFPAQDVEGHRRYHELMIKRNEEIRSLRMAIQEKTISGLIFAAIGFVFIAVWHEVKSKMWGN